MSYDLTNKQGGHWKCSNSLWSVILKTANEAGWEPQGTVMYRHSGIHPDMTTIQVNEEPTVTMIIEAGSGDMALGFDQATKSGEIIPDWDGSYIGNEGQIITAPDAANMAAALKRSIEAGDWEDNANWIGDLIAVLEVGEVRIT